MRLALVGLLIAVGGANLLSASDWEALEPRKAGDVLPGQQLQGDAYEIGAAVETDGFVNLYDLQTTFGPFSADSDWELEIRLLEVGAMVQLAEVTKSKAFADSLGDAALAPVDAAVGLVSDPVGTTRAAARGVANLFSRSKRVAKEVTAKKEEAPAETESDAADEKPSSDKRDLANAALGTEKQVRLWAYKLRVDPYSDNDALSAELERVAKASAMGGSSLNLRSFDTIEGGMPDVSEDVYKLSAADLRARNEKILDRAGLSPESVEPFFESALVSPTMRTIIVDCFARLEGVEGREDLIDMALAAQTVDEARFQVGHAEFLAAFHARTRPLRAIDGSPTIPAATTDAGDTILLIAADHLSWTEELAGGVRGRLDALAGSLGGDGVDLFVAGGATALAVQGLEGMGVRVEPNEL